MMYRALKNCRHGDIRFNAGDFADFASPPPASFWAQAEMVIDKPMTLREYSRQSNTAMDFNEAMALIAANPIKTTEVL